MPSCYLNTYTPLAWNELGRQAIAQFGIPPLVDGSIRREPDLQHERPGISGLCRTDKFVPRLSIGDRVAYLTKKSDFGTSRSSHQRLTAVLEVTDVLPSHEAAAEWYRGNNLPLPSNCMVAGNPCEPLERSHRICSCPSEMPADSLVEQWDLEYRERAKLYPTFVVCRVLHRQLTWHARIVTDDHLTQVFGKRPGTQNPGAIDCVKLAELLSLLDVSLSAP